MNRPAVPLAAAGSWWQRTHPETNLALLAGVMMTTALPPFAHTGLLAIAALALLLHLVTSGSRPVHAAWVFGLAHQATLLYWLFLLDPAKSIPTRWLVPTQAILTILYVALFYLAFGAAIRLVRRFGGDIMALALSPVLWIAMEALRGWGEMGFPWCLTGSAWLGSRVGWLAAASGEIGLSAATAFTAAAAVALARGWRRLRVGSTRRAEHAVDPPADAHQVRSSRWPAPALAVATAVIWIGLGLGARDTWRGESEGDPRGGGVTAPLTVAAIQADVALADKWDQTKIDSTRTPYTELTAGVRDDAVDLIVWAETAVPSYLRYDTELLEWVREQARSADAYLFVGFPDADRTPAGERRKFNSSGLFSPTGELVDRYAKHHLLPIGERMPFSRYLPFLARLDVGQAEWQPGEKPAPLTMNLHGRAHRFAALICFEAIFADLARQAVRRGAGYLVNITNDGWFGRTAGPRQHAELARLRAIECGVPMVRCANNGISFVCDGRGTVLARAGLGQRRAIVAEIFAPHRQTSFVRLGLWPLASLLLVWSGLVVAIHLRRRI